MSRALTEINVLGSFTRNLVRVVGAEIPLGMLCAI
jgi:hypothetical protein